MSLKSMISGSSDSDKEFQAILRDILPGKEEYQTISKVIPFGAYEPLAPYSLSKRSDASVVGTAFDYLARAMIAQQLNANKDDAYLGLVALAGLKKMKKQLDKKIQDLLIEKYIDVLADFIDYIYSNNAHITKVKVIVHRCVQEEWNAYSKFVTTAASSRYKLDDDVNRLLSGAYFFAKLEQVYRSGGILPEDINSFFADPNEEIQRDLQNLCRVFKEKFIGAELIGPDSTVIFNPTFGLGSIMCGGADADVYVDGALYDFKTSKDTGYNWKEVAQILGYFFLNGVAYYGREYNLPAPLMEYKILRIALYKARYGQIEYFETSKMGLQTIKKTTERLARYFQKHPDNLNWAILGMKIPPDITPEIFDAPYPLADLVDQ